MDEKTSLQTEFSYTRLAKGLVTNYGEGGATKLEGGGHLKFYPYEKGGGQTSFSHAEGGGGAQQVLG